MLGKGKKAIMQENILKLHDEIRLKDKMIELMAEAINEFKRNEYNVAESIEETIKYYQIDAQKQLVAEQNKKAACSNASI